MTDSLLQSLANAIYISKDDIIYAFQQGVVIGFWAWGFKQALVLLKYFIKKS